MDKERLGRRAIKAIHEQMDDDKDGLIEASESQDVKKFLLMKNKFLGKKSFSLFMKN